METIRTYVENMFACLPDTAEMQDLKQEILSNMEEKYNELKENGSSEPEAVSRVIADFGDIDEILDSYHIRPEETGNTQRLLSREEAECYVAAKHSANRQTGAGVMLCILAPALMLLFFMLMPGSLSDDPSVLGIILGFSSLFLSIAIGVSLFILS